ncbi:MAG TPA: hypothetical protein VMT24_12600 [Aggregatilineaceae bacterium]|nr:hypothetical protein [Aggregatilineaceae bacterium]
MGDETRISIRFDAEHTATAIRAGPYEPPPRVLAALSLPPYNGIIVVHGGAGNMEVELIDAVRAFVIAGLAPFAQARHILIVDGGTQTGVSRVMGDARQEIEGTYPLLGVVPYRYVVYPGGPTLDGERIPLNPSHTHFIFVEGDEFGAESELLVGLLRTSGKPGLALIINGGDIVLKEVMAHVAQGNTLVTVRGSGRIADKLSDPASEERAALPPGARLYVADLGAPQDFAALLARLLPGSPC